MRQIAEGGQIPRGYGIAYYDMRDRSTICYPFGLHWMVGLWRIVVWHLSIPPWRFYELRRRKALVARRGCLIVAVSEMHSAGVRASDIEALCYFFRRDLTVVPGVDEHDQLPDRWRRYVERTIESETR